MLKLDAVEAAAERTRGYTGWSPDGDYLSGKGWTATQSYPSFQAFCDAWSDGDRALALLDDDMNLVADFYFDARLCTACEGGYTADYKAECDRLAREGWGSLTDVDFEAWRAGDAGLALADKVTTRKQWIAALEGRQTFSLVGGMTIYEVVCARLAAAGLAVDCPVCKGEGSTDEAGVDLQLWILHPRKGAGRGVTIENIQPEDLDPIRAWLRRSFDKHREHFAWVLGDGPGLAPALGPVDQRKEAET
jgi:hypothetical protein